MPLICRNCTNKLKTRSQVKFGKKLWMHQCSDFVIYRAESTCGYFKFLPNEKCYFWHFLVSKFDLGVEYFNWSGLEIAYSFNEIGLDPGNNLFEPQTPTQCPAQK